MRISMFGVMLSQNGSMHASDEEPVGHDRPSGTHGSQTTAQAGNVRRTAEAHVAASSGFSADEAQRQPAQGHSQEAQPARARNCQRNTRMLCSNMSL